MEVSACCEFFEANEGNLKIVDLLIAEEDRFAWENQKASRVSPGLVLNEELQRHIQQPLYYNPKTKSLTPEAFSDAFNKGLSTDRFAFTSREEIIARGHRRDAAYAAQHPEKPERTTIALACFDSSRIRQFQSESGLQSFGIFDTAQKDNIAHADVCALNAGNVERRRARAYLDSIHRLEFI